MGGTDLDFEARCRQGRLPALEQAVVDLDVLVVGPDLKNRPLDNVEVAAGDAVAGSVEPLG
jgi:hypothetical protein